MKKVLFITYHYLIGKGGGVFATKAYINAFSEIAEEFVLLFPNKGNYEICDISPSVCLKPIDINKYSFFDKAFNYIFGKYNYFIVENFEKVLNELSPNVVVFDNSHISYTLIDMAHSCGAKVITLHHNYEVDFVRDNSSCITRFVNIYWTKKIEKAALLKSDINLFITAYDIHRMSMDYKIKIKNAFVIGCFEYIRTKRIFLDNDFIYSSKSFIITGNLSSRQTEKSVICWLRDYYPMLVKMIPSHVLVIAGKSPSLELKSICSKHSNIQLIDSPANMDIFLSKAHYYICPTMLGSGLKLRLMDGLKYGLPVLTHEVSSRGYESFVEKGYIKVYNDLDSFCVSLDSLMNSSYRREDIQSLYDNIFSFDNGVKRLRSLIDA